LGFKPKGKPFDEAGIKHIKMVYEKWKITQSQS
jgi:predicted GNAT family N-acyltransferase